MEKPKIIETKISTILRRTSINLAPYVVNPYQGCAVGCSFCYAQFSKKARKEEMKWGSYVRVKVNALEVLEEELDRIRPEKILLGSTTEIFQPAEEQYHITEEILKLLNTRGIPYVIMSRSPKIKKYIPLLKQGNCADVYFTVNAFPEELAKLIREKSPAAETGIKTAAELKQNGLPVTAYLCPVMPGYNNWKHVLEGLKGIGRVECEVINFVMAGDAELWDRLKEVMPLNAMFYERILSRRELYEELMNMLKEDISATALALGIDVKIHLHKYQKYFENEYRK